MTFSQKLSLLFVLFLLPALCAARGGDTIHVHEGLKIVPLTKNTYLHISYIPYEGGQIPCNGLVFMSEDEAVVLDTPVTDSMSIYLIRWVTETLGVRIKYMVANHFHEDCIGGLDMFFDYGSINYSHKLTCKLSEERGFNCTQHYFTDTLTLRVGSQKVECWYPGPAHTVDNTVAYIPSERVLFGGCMVKEMNGSKGNLRDADTAQWSNSVSKVKVRFPKAKTVVPGHGKPGSKKLLNYTIKLFAD